jgi:hypothetical protein
MSLLGQYEYIIKKSHPRANADGAVYVHVIIAEEKLGRYLLPEEVVHHRDLNKLNNNPNNLMIFASNSDHSRFHANGCDESTLSLNENGVYVCEKREYICIDCGEEITRYGLRCKKCAAIHERKASRPTQTELLNMILNHNGNFTKVAKEYGVSDNVVRKWCDSYNMSRKSRDYKV